jgi:O-antigen/teichoic acid export membrane protein
MIINLFGNEYIGLTVLYRSIFSILSLSELGLGVTLMAFLFEYIKNEDNYHLLLILEYFKKLYFRVGTFFLITGFVIALFLEILIPNTTVSLLDSTLILLLLLSTEIMKYYFFEYKNVFLYANQEQNKTSRITFIVSLLQYIIEIFILVIFQNYFLYLLLVIIFNVLKGLLISKLFSKSFKKIFLLKLNPKESLSLHERSKISKSLQNLFILKLGGRLFDSTDNIIIAQLLGIAVVGLYSNYLLFLSIASSLVGVLRSSFQPILGKIFHTYHIDSKKLIYNSIQLFNFILIFNASFAFQSLVVPVINIWIGNEYLLDFLTPLLMSINFFALNSIVISLFVYESLGLFHHGKWRNLIGSLINIFLSIYLGNLFGIVGVLFATTIAYSLAGIFFFPNLINKLIFNISSYDFVIKFTSFLVILILTFILNSYMQIFLSLEFYILFITIEIIFVNLSFFHFLRSSPEFLWLKSRIFYLFKKINNN